MPTPFLHFTKDPNEDITNAPQYYHDFVGAAVRIRAYWTTPIWQNALLWSQSHRLIRRAASILKKYTLSLDVKPPGATSVGHAAIRAKVEAKLKSVVGPAVIGTLARVPLVTSIAEAFVDQAVDDATATLQGLIKFDRAISVPSQATPPIEQFKQLRRLIEPVMEENRLIVVFVPIVGGANGYTARFPDWLPWVLVDPRDPSDDTALLHEMGHACRLAHQQMNTPAADVHNVMSYGYGLDQLWGWQVDTIYDSYWCQGRRPKDWWVNQILPAGNPFLWDEAS
jgi:hypothetical protein